MAVQVPTVERFQPQPEQSVGRVEMKPLDVAGPANVVKTAANQFINEVATQYEQHVKYSAEVEGKKLAREYNDFLRGKYDGKPGKLGVKYIDGDPEPGYAKFREDSTSKYNELMGKYSGASDTLKKAITKNLNEIKYKFDDLATTSQAAQLDKYQTNVVMGDVAMTKEDMLDLSGNIDITKPDPFMDIDYSLNKIQNAWMDHGKVRGTVEVSKDEKGNEIARPSSPVALRIAKDKSDALEAVIANLRTSGRVREATAVAEKYKDDIDANARPKINDDLKKANLEQQSYAEADKVQFLDIKTAEAKLDQIKDPELKEKALEKYGTYKARMDRLDDLKQGEMYSSVFNDVLAKQTSGQPFVSVDEMMSDPKFKARIEKMTKPENVKALMAMIKPKEESDPKALIGFITDAVNGGMYQLTKEQLAVKMAPLSAKDHKWALDVYKLINLDTEPEKRSRLNSVIPRIKESLLLQEVISPEKAGRGYTEEDTTLMATAIQEATRALGDIPQDATQQQAWVDRFVRDLKKRIKPDPLTKWINETFGSVFGANKEPDYPLEPRAGYSPDYSTPVPSTVLSPGAAPVPTPNATSSPRATVAPTARPSVMSTPFASPTVAPKPSQAMKSLKGAELSRVVKDYWAKYPDRKGTIPTDVQLSEYLREVSK